MGTITDHSGLLTQEFSLGAYSIEQWINGTFYRVHETFNILFLYNGLSGIFLYLAIAKTVLFNFYKNPWILIGGFWFLMFYSFSATMTVFGLIALLLGYSYLDKMNKNI